MGLRIFALTLLLAQCGWKSGDDHVVAAGALRARYSESAMSRWNVRVAAAGRDCDVLLVRTDMILDESMVEAMHYGTGHYRVYDGGVRQFYRERAFRGVAYRDATNALWAYGDVTAVEARGLAPCP